jgi:15-cis-phytoene synthase
MADLTTNSTPQNSSHAAMHRDSVRLWSMDHYLSIWFFPAHLREDVFILYAFFAEICRIPNLVTDPMIGEVRLQWWYDALSGSAKGDVNAHPLASDLLKLIERYALPQDYFLEIIEAKTFDLYQEAIPTLVELKQYIQKTFGHLLMLMCKVVLHQHPMPPPLLSMIGHGGQIMGLTSILRHFPHDIARQRIFLPLDYLNQCSLSVEDVFTKQKEPNVIACIKLVCAEIKTHLSAMEILKPAIPETCSAAFLPLALTGGYLQILEKPNYDPYTTPIEYAVWKKQWLLWRAARSFGHKSEA